MKSKKLQKQKEKYQKKIARKPKLSREIIRASVISLVIMVLICVLISNFLADKYTYWGDHLLTAETDSLDQKITDIEDRFAAPVSTEIDENQITDELIQDSSGNIIDKINFRTDYPITYYDYMFLEYYSYWLAFAKHNSQLEFASYKVVFDKNGEKISDGSNDIYQIIIWGQPDDPDRVVRMCRLDFDSIDSIYPGLSKRILEDLESHYNYDLSESISIELGDIYYDDVYFIPSSLDIVKSTDDGATTEILASFDLSDCDFSKLTKLDTSDERLRTFPTIAIGASDNNPSKLFFEEFDKETLASYVAATESGAVTERFTFTNSRIRACKLVKTVNDSYIVASFVDLDFYRDFKDGLIIFYIIMTIISLIVGVAAGYIRFNKLQVPYEIDSYRRNTTNSMAHDLKTPLMAISGYAENIATGENLEQSRKSAENILESVKYMDQMITNILELSKLENNNIKLNVSDVDAKELTQKCLKKYEAVLEKKHITTNINGNHVLKTDEHLMERLIDNLLSNASKYGSENSDFSIDITNTNITFTNNYDTEITTDVDSLTKPFVKGDNARENVEGNGLGLSIVQNIASVLGLTLLISAKDSVFTVSIKY